MDPLDVAFVDVHDLILQHFNAKDVIKCSLVSKSWHEIIGLSRKCMSKIWLNIDRPASQIRLLNRSDRKYENFRIQSGMRKELAKVLLNFRPKIAIITDDGHGDGIDHGDYLSFMNSLAPTVEQLHPGEASTINANRVNVIDFYKLKELQYTLTSRSAFSIFLGSNPKLEKVLLSFNNEVSREFLQPTNIVHEFLQRNRQIKSLWMCEIDCAFQSDLTENCGMDLRTFAFGKTSSKIAVKVKDNLVKFIKSQTGLEWLKILCLHDTETFVRIWSEGSFRKLFIMDCNFKGALCHHELITNHHVDEINFYLNPSCYILKFLQASPNLKSFKIRQLSKQIMNFCISNLMKLEKIQYQSVENDVVKIYDNLKATSDSPGSSDINRTINLEEMNFFEFVGRDAGF